MKRSISAISALVLLLALLLPSVALGTVGEFREDWNPARQGTESAEDCTGDDSLGADPDEAIIHWIFTSDATTNAVLTVIVDGNAETYLPVKESGSATHFVTPFVDFADIDNAFVTYDGVAGRNVGLRISHWCDGPDEPEVRDVPPPTISKTANGTFRKAWTWDVEKDVTTPRVVEIVNGNAVFGYSIHVTHSAPDISNIRVRGVITLYNPSNFDIDIVVTDPSLSDGTPCELRDPSTLTILAGETVNIAYRCFLDAVKDDLTNTAYVHWAGFERPVNQDNVIFRLIAGDRDTGAVGVGALEVNLVNECTTLNDTNAAGPQGVVICIGDKDADGNNISEPTFTYTRTIPAPAGFGCDKYDNTATIVNSDNGGDEDSESVYVCHFRARLTPGYWKNHLTTGTPNTAQYLPQSLNGYVVGTTAKATAVFNAMNCGASTTQGAIGCLAGHLLATELNIANSSNTCINPTVVDANLFLAGDLNKDVAGVQSYTGPTGVYSLSAEDRATAIALKSTLDVYNNGGGCILP